MIYFDRLSRIASFPRGTSTLLPSSCMTAYPCGEFVTGHTPLARLLISAPLNAA